MQQEMATSGRSNVFETERVSLEFRGPIAVLKMIKKDNRFSLDYLRDMNEALDLARE